jgi:hypothetical protein
MNAPDWYPAWRHDAIHELMAKQERARETYRVGDWSRFDYDADVGTLIFSEDGVAKVIADIQIVGTTAERDWLWSWANPHWSGCCVDEMHNVRDFGAKHGIEELISEYLEDDDLNNLGWEMTAVAARILGAAGAYRPPDETGCIFLVCQSFRFVS